MFDWRIYFNVRLSLWSHHTLYCLKKDPVKHD